VGHSQVFPFCEYVFVPGKSLLKVQPEMPDVFFMRELYIVHMYWGGHESLCVVNVAWTDLDPNKQKTPWPLVRERTIPTERPPLVDEI
jgi:hypothetical protein